MSDWHSSAMGQAVALADRHLGVISVAASVAVFVPGALIGPGWSDAAPGVVGSLILLVLTYFVGYRVDPVAGSLLLMAALALCSTAGDLSGSVVSMWVFTVPAWVIGRVMRSRSLVSVRLAERADELDAEREAFALESVRYERARIARDLHDVVAHNLSMIVVQAAAGRRSLASDPGVAAESLRHIESGALRASCEITQLVTLLAEHEGETGDDLSRVDALVRQAAAAGLSVTYAYSGSHERVSREVGEVAFRVAQEGITNALKHAPGAGIRVEVQVRASALCLTIENGAPHDRSLRLQDVGGCFGIIGIRDRVTALGGTLESGPVGGDGWRLAVGLPTVQAGSTIGL